MSEQRGSWRKEFSAPLSIPSAVLVSLGCLIVALLIVSGCSGDTNVRLVILGLDAANWHSMEPLLEEGRLPNLSRLIHHGVAGSIQTFIPTASPAIWTSMATGHAPDKHGIAFRVLQINESGGQEEMLDAISSDEREVKALWNLLGDYGIRSAFVSWWATWPSEEVLGYMVSDRIHDSALKRTTFPQDLRDELSGHGILDMGLPHQETAWIKNVKAEFRTWRGQVEEGKIAWNGEAPDTKRYFQDLEEKLQAYQRIMTMDYRTEQITHYLMEKDKKLEVIAPYFWYMDICQHVLWKYWQPEGYLIDEKELEIFGKLVPHYYEFIDGVVGRVLEHAGRKTAVIAVSDHGMESHFADRFLNELFDVEGLLMDMGWLIRRENGDPDLSKSSAYVVAQARQMRLLNLSLQGRDPGGRIPVKDKRPTAIKLAEALGGLTTSRTQKKLFGEVRVLEDNEHSYRSGEFVHYVFEDADLVVTINDHVDLDDSLNIGESTYPLKRWNKWRPSISGQHHRAPPGMIVMTGPPFGEGIRISGARVYDVLPTTMAALGLPIATEMEGKLLSQGFRSGFFDQVPLKTISSYGPRPPFVKERVRKGSLDADLIDQLKAIGYVR